MTEKQRAYDSAQTKERILSHAQALFSQKGYKGVSISDICEATGLSKGSIYHHFKNKEDLFVHLAEAAFADSWKDWDSRSARFSSAVDKLYAYSELFADNADLSLTKAGEDFIATIGADSAVVQKFAAIITGYVQRFEEIIREGIERGEFKQQESGEMAFAVLSSYSGLANNTRFLDKENVRRMYRKMTDMLLDGIRK
ncbi:transcriptional regulator, TetR family [Paenibacillus sophorae]|uniref:TetR/AcrR family transcriptional regulator n=1 Tax=Paenibacillus sophorae TaxID=1333845 RepID=A0A1H8RBT7_9BACL|nr:TetR/AcrR family transcriptional regulator [Paenibacillus sophorae]QWU15025.1 TetR/AcrR family transcriptional regulator [Paenibacillus sophorae]SEO63737.1 transcriptional regulator, TetR family [Paenibacillus sophorae]